jgi:hypothetical protein
VKSLKSVRFIYYVTVPAIVQGVLPPHPQINAQILGRLITCPSAYYRVTGATPRRNDRVASLRYRTRTRLIAPATAQRNIVLAPRACSALLDVEDLESGLLGVFVEPGVEVVVVVLLDEEESGRPWFVGLGDTGVDVDVEGPGGGGVGEDEGSGDTGVGVGVVGVAGTGVEVEEGLGVGVVLDPPVIVNCGLALPESPNTSGMEKEAHARSPHAARWFAST